MTRTHVAFPVWAWFCDRCGATSGDLAKHQGDLPDADQMRARGWFIADLFGDLCSTCQLAKEDEA